MHAFVWYSTVWIDFYRLTLCNLEFFLCVCTTFLFGFVCLHSSCELYSSLFPVAILKQHFINFWSFTFFKFLVLTYRFISRNCAYPSSKAGSGVPARGSWENPSCSDTDSWSLSMDMCVSYLPGCCDKTPDKVHLREEMFILSRSSKRGQPWQERHGDRHVIAECSEEAGIDIFLDLDLASFFLWCILGPPQTMEWHCVQSAWVFQFLFIMPGACLQVMLNAVWLTAIAIRLCQPPTLQHGGVNITWSMSVDPSGNIQRQEHKACLRARKRALLIYTAIGLLLLASQITEEYIK